jgi:cytoskeletal protein CcmA (bactofilin family)
MATKKDTCIAGVLENDSHWTHIPKLERAPEVNRMLDEQSTCVAYRVKSAPISWREVEVGDILIADTKLPAYEKDIVILDYEGVSWLSRCLGGNIRYSGIVLEIRKATTASKRRDDRKKVERITTTEQILARISSEMPKRYAMELTLSGREDATNIAQISKEKVLSSITIGRDMGDVVVPHSVSVQSLLVEEGTNLIITGDLQAREDVIVRGSLSVDGKVKCDDRLYIAGDFQISHLVNCGRLLVGGNVRGRCSIDVKECAAVGGSVDIEGDAISCIDLFVGGDLCTSLWTENATIAGNVKSKGLIHVDNDLSVGRDLRAEEVEAGGSIAVGGTLWSKTVIAAGKTNEIACAKRVRGRIKSGTLRELDPSAMGSIAVLNSCRHR